MPTIKIVIIGDSYTSGEGANSSAYATTPPVFTSDGMVPPLIYPQHQSSTSPAMQAVAALQAANPGVNIQVTNVAVSGATRESASLPSQPGTFFEQPAQLAAVKGADVILSGFAGGNDNRFGDWGKNALVAPDSFMPTVFNSLYLPNFQNGTNLTNQTDFLNGLAQLAPGATVVTPGYPQVFQGQTAPSWSMWSPFVSSLGTNAANLSDQFAQWLNADASAATGAANVANLGTGTTFLYANVSNALDGHALTAPDSGMNGIVPFSWGQGSMNQASFHPNPLGQQLEASALYPVLAAAVARGGAQNGVTISTDAPASIVATPSFQQNAADVRAQLSLVTQLQQATDMAKVAQQAQDGQLTNPDGTPTLWGEYMSGLAQLNGQQTGATSPDAPGSAGNAPGAPNADPAAPSSWTAPPAPAAPPAPPASQPDQSGAPQGVPQGSDPQGTPPQGATPQSSDPQGTPPQGATPQSSDPQGQPTGATWADPAATDPGTASTSPDGQTSGSSPSFTSSPDPTGANPGSAPAPVANSAPAPAAPPPAVSAPAPIPTTQPAAVSAPAPIPAAPPGPVSIPTPIPTFTDPVSTPTPIPAFTPPPAISTPSPTFTSPAPISDPGPVVVATGGFSGGAGSG